MHTHIADKQFQEARHTLAFGQCVPGLKICIGLVDEILKKCYLTMLHTYVCIAYNLQKIFSMFTKNS